MTDDALVEGLKAVAHPLRLRILRALTGAERNVGEIDAVAQIGQPMLSQQLAVLRGAGLVQTRREAKLVFYRIDEARLSALSQMLDQLHGGSAAPSPEVRRNATGAARFARMA
ncbi:ArsR family transcriptional regulator [Erythrobacteraceae bacterium CFH 75059]|uniref:ArsR/SmtB family transcription factor n=1 Tax=Qipengyuania thermophila TaxID=2509361 RepID=UPI00101F944E|nr:metalloregulator ArsR/SmtB family transcription factor [Qipengyuania thermophila]TCD04984.1 ArsR family transcriptional regulator [Erythrobacteraceae bacterium CFH 75059]